MPNEKSDSKKTCVKIMDQLKELISNGTYTIGKRLPPERELASMYGVSRPTIREALSALEVLGILDIQIGSGAYVKSVSGHTTIESEADGYFSPTELLEARLPVEGAMAALAAIKASNTAISEMKEIYAQLVQDVNEENYQPEKDRLLHLKIAESTKNIHFVEIIKYFNKQMDNDIWRKFSEQIPQRTERLINNHLSIIQAIEDRDPDKARAMMEMHINIGLKTYFFNDEEE